MGSSSIAASALVCEDATLEGNVTIGAGTVVHPRCSILAVDGGSIVIGSDCVIEEQVVITNGPGGGNVVVGDMNLFEVGARIEADKIGSCNVFEPKSALGAGVTVGDGCVVGATAELAAVAVPNDTVVYRCGPEGKLHTRVQPRSKARHAAQISRYLDILREPESRCCLLNFHNLKDR
eukprot:g3152.t1